MPKGKILAKFTATIVIHAGQPAALAPDGRPPLPVKGDPDVMDAADLADAVDTFVTTRYGFETDIKVKRAD